MAWAPDYTTLARFKSFLRVTDIDDDVQLAVDITTASRAIDKACCRQFGVLTAATEWTYTARWDRHRNSWMVSVDDFATVTGLVVKVDGVVTTDFVKEPVRAVDKGGVWTQLRLPAAAIGGVYSATSPLDNVKVTALWGWSAVPVSVENACWLQAARFAARRDSPYGIAGSPAEGSEMRLLATVDPDVRVSLGPYVRLWGAV